MRRFGVPARLLAVGAVVWLLAVPSLWLTSGDASTIDGAWMTSMADAWRWDLISGRDFYATYGWGFEALGAFATRLHIEDNPFDSATLIEMLMSWVGALSLGLALFLSRRLDPAGILLVGSLPCVLSLLQYAWARPALLVLVAFATARALGTEVRARWPLAVVAGFATALQAMSFDTGLFSTVLVLAGGGLIDALGRSPARAEEIGGVAGIKQRFRATWVRFWPALAAAGAINGLFWVVLAVGPAGLFDYPRNLVGLAGGYRFTLASPWLLPPEIGWSVGLALLFVVVLAVWEVATRRAGRERGGYELPLLAIASLLSIQSGVVRAGLGHLSLAIVPLVVACAYASCRRRASWRVRALGCVCLLALLGSWPAVSFKRVLTAGQALVAPTKIWQRFGELRRLAPSASIYRPQPLRSGDGTLALLVFPYQNHWTLLARRRPVAPFVQAYQATTADLERQYVARLASEPPFEVLFGFDSLASHPIDGVQSISRNPFLFEHLWRNFGIADVADGYARLRRLPEPRSFGEAPLAFAVAAAPDGSMNLLLDRPGRCALLRVGMRIDYPFAAAVGRPANLRLSVLSDQTPLLEATLVRLGDGVFSTLVSLVPGPEFASVLAGNAQGRDFDRLILRTADTSFLAVAPRRVRVESLACLSNPS